MGCLPCLCFVFIVSLLLLSDCKETFTITFCACSFFLVLFTQPPSVCITGCLIVVLCFSDKLSVQIFVEMPFDIKDIECPTHKIKMKVSELEKLLIYFVCLFVY